MQTLKSAISKTYNIMAAVGGSRMFAFTVGLYVGAMVILAQVPTECFPGIQLPAVK